MPNIGPLELLLLGLLAVIIFGPQKLPEIGRSIGRSMREFKDSVSGEKKEKAETRSELPPPAPATTSEDTTSAPAQPERETESVS